MKKLDRDFYNRDSIIVAKELLGKVLVHEIEGQRISARIIETEAYMGVVDKAAHSYNGRRTKRVEVMYGDPGISYIFMIYGLHCCFNVVVNEKEIPQAILVRAVEPLEGKEWMAQKRFGKAYELLTKSQRRGLTNGPGKLCSALSIDRNYNGADLCGSVVFIEDGESEDFNIVTTKRIGIDYAEEAKDFPWRFYIEGNEYVSVK
ncbi:DNA-3-methyladenine glycosylase [Lacrimispora sp.]|jgi:DNA-3-methyladenine glycosylase|uniref:DNA-3-methyladenine glycosylase n=1 Tax=Lacrimispora sp. TaxID=2719234 RepID=UPI0028A691B7|nr:DNA-3-methyladenine glycosylase [Lacrimispora sp.]